MSPKWYDLGALIAAPAPVTRWSPVDNGTIGRVQS